MRRAFWVWGAFGVWGAALSGCVRSSEAFVEIALDVAVALPGGETPDAPMELQALGGLCGDPGLTYPRCEIARQPLGAGEAAEGWLVRVPQEVAELEGGLFVYAWADLDGDGILCAPDVEEPAGIAEVPGFPTFEAAIEVRLDQPCAGPEIAIPG